MARNQLIRALGVVCHRTLPANERVIRTLRRRELWRSTSDGAERESDGEDNRSNEVLHESVSVDGRIQVRKLTISFSLNELTIDLSPGLLWNWLSVRR